MNARAFNAQFNAQLLRGNECKLAKFTFIISGLKPLAEGMRFELTIRFYPYNGLANRRLQPLGHPSAGSGDFTRRMRGWF